MPELFDAYGRPVVTELLRQEQAEPTLAWHPQYLFDCR